MHFFILQFTETIPDADDEEIEEDEGHNSSTLNESDVQKFGYQCSLSEVYLHFKLYRS